MTADPAPLYLPAVPEIPMFEGLPVTTTKLKMGSIAAMDLGNQVLRMDHIVQMVVEVRISGVDHKANARGELERIQTALPLNVRVLTNEEIIGGLRV